ncbi:MAG: hypothetical protein ABJE95_10735 [Byssovorax sp.]
MKTIKRTFGAVSAAAIPALLLLAGCLGSPSGDTGEQDNSDSQDEAVSSCIPSKTKSGDYIQGASGCFSWAGKTVHYTSAGAAVFPYDGIIGTVTSPAVPGDWEIVALGASHGGDTNPPQEVNTVFKTTTTKMVAQGFTLIGDQGELDKKVELWFRHYKGPIVNKIAVPTDAKSYNILVLKGTDVRLKSELFTHSRIESSGEPWTVPSLTGSDLKILAYFGDDSVQVTNTQGGELLFNEWGFGDGDSLNVMLYAPGSALPSKIGVVNHAIGGRQYVGILANFPRF